MKRIWRESENYFRNQAIKLGVTFVDSDRQAFAHKVKPLYERLRLNKPDVYRVVEEIRAN